MHISSTKRLFSSAKFVTFLYITATIFSYLYIIIFDVYNGDFINKDVYLDSQTLLVIFVITVLPYICIYIVYKKYKRKESTNESIHYNLNYIRNITWFLIFIQILLLTSGYGQMGGDSIKINGGIYSYVRAIFFKLTIKPWLVTYFLLAKNKKSIIITTILFSIHTILAHSLGGFFLLAILYTYKYFEKVKRFFKHNIIFVSILVCFIPNLVNVGYTIRSHLREGVGMSENSMRDIMMGKLCGRISSFSNNAYIFQNAPQIIIDSPNIPSFFYLYDILHYWGYRPEFKSTGAYVNIQIKHSSNENLSVMPGIMGVLILSFVKSKNILLFNIILIICLLFLVFMVLHRMKIEKSADIAFLLTIGFATSGDISELSTAIYILLFIWFTLSILNKISLK